jgi:DNA invertase Pin-like site-specific DNA recombinase
MNQGDHDKVTAHHLQREAYLYVRQSSLRQVLENTESTVRQYALKERAIALGWPLERIVVIDGDQGHSGASAADRAGFQKLVAEVGLGHVGIVLGLEVSRLARNNSDWHRLLEICGLTATLILDEDGVYDPAAFNDRLLLGLKGSLSEAELHVLRARLRGGILNKARRGALKLPLPVGLEYREDGQVIRDPDQQVQQAVQLLFETFRRLGSATGTVKLFREQSLTFPHRVHNGPHRGELLWQPLQHSTVLHLLHNPRYAGAFVFGRTRNTKLDGRLQSTKLPREQWTALFLGAHEGYISWVEYEENQKRLRENAQAHQIGDGKNCPPREGPALLQGIAVCGRCGELMGIHYHQRQGRLVPDYLCQRQTIREGRSPCQHIPGEAVDRAVGELLVKSITPQALEIALAVEAEVRARAEEANLLRQAQVERARYEADLAQRRFLRVDPDNRLVADVLEAEWNARLRQLKEAQEQVEQQHQSARAISEEERAAIMALAQDVPRLWHSKQVNDRERKRMLRLMIADVTLMKEGEAITAQVRFVGGASVKLQVTKPKPATLTHHTDPVILREIDRLLEQYTDSETAAQLNAAGYRSCEGKSFKGIMITSLRRSYRLSNHYSRLRQRGLLTAAELANQLDVCTDTVERWHHQGLIKRELANDRNEWLYYRPERAMPAKWKHRTQIEKKLLETHIGGAV